MEKKLVTIVLPVYNGAGHIEKSIQSVINQSYKNWELIIVNDCSTDNTLEIAESYSKQDNRIKVYSNPRNLKLPKTLNEGFLRATGDYYTWTSDDNVYKVDAIGTLVYALESSDAVMVYSDYTIIDENDEIIGERKLQEAEKLMLGNVFGACFLYRAEAAKAVGEYDSSLFLAEDYDYWIRMFQIGKILHLTDILYNYRIHAKSLTSTREEMIKSQTFKVLEKHFLFLLSQIKDKMNRYYFYDHLVSYAPIQIKNKIQQELKSMDIGYEIYLTKKQIKRKLKDIKNRLLCTS